MLSPARVPVPPSAPASVERFFRCAPPQARPFLLSAFLDAAREEGATIDTVIADMRELFAGMRTGPRQGGLDSYQTHRAGFALYYHCIDAPWQLRDAASYALYSVAFERSVTNGYSSDWKSEGEETDRG